MVNCVNCTIYIAACERIAFVDKCERVSFTVATNLLRVCNTHDSNIYYYGPSPILLTGDNKAISVGPNNSSSPELQKYIKAANIAVHPDNFYSFEQVLFKNMLMTNENCWSKMPPSEFDLLVLPEKEDEDERSPKNAVKKQ